MLIAEEETENAGKIERFERNLVSVEISPLERQIQVYQHEKMVKKLARIEASSICRQQFTNFFADCFCAIHTHQLEFANTSLPTLVCRVKAAL